jgi:hypothetical protein
MADAMNVAIDVRMNVRMIRSSEKTVKEAA